MTTYPQTHPTTTNLVQNKNSLQGLENNNPQSDTNRCRICLESTGQLIQLPCSCVGETGLIHESCFSEWIKTIKDSTSPLRRQGDKIKRLSANVYQTPCEICKGPIDFQMNKSVQCLKCRDLKKPPHLFSAFCILFNICVIVVVSYLCISSLASSSNTSSSTVNGVRIVINLTILGIVYITFGWLVKREVRYLYTTKISDLKIKTKANINQPNQPNHSNQAAHQSQINNFVIQQELQPPRNSSKGGRTGRNRRAQTRNDDYL